MRNQGISKYLAALRQKTKSQHRARSVARRTARAEISQPSRVHTVKRPAKPSPAAAKSAPAAPAKPPAKG